MDELEIGRTLLLFLWAFGLAGIEIEIEGGVGWAQRLPTWYLKRGLTGRIYGLVMGQRPLTGYHVYAFTIPMLILHLPYVLGVHWTLAGELVTVATYFVLAVVWDYLWFVLNPAYTVRRFRRGNVYVVALVSGQNSEMTTPPVARIRSASRAWARGNRWR